jgi:hypothetical protein
LHRAGDRRGSKPARRAWRTLPCWRVEKRSILFAEAVDYCSTLMLLLLLQMFRDVASCKLGGVTLSL